MRPVLLFVPLLVACAPGPVERTVDCDPESVDLWRIPNSEAGLYTVRVDTVDDGSKFDPDAFLYTTTAWGEGQYDVRADELLGYGDDDMPCSFVPEGGYACPQILANVPEDPAEDLLVVVGLLGSCAHVEVAYELTVEHNSVPARVRYHGKALSASFTEEPE